MDDFRVPVIAVFTKYDQFKRNIKMKLEDEGRGRLAGAQLDTEVENVFKQYYLDSLSGHPPLVRLESEDFLLTVHTYRNLCSIEMHKPDQKCTDLLEATADALGEGVVALMLMAVQRDNLELSVKQAIKR